MSPAKTPTQINAASVPVAALQARKKEGEAARKKYDTNWVRNWNLYISKQWEGIATIAWFQSTPVYNKVFEFVEIMRAMLADQKWGIDAMPMTINATKNGDPADVATKANNVLDFLWDDAHIQSKLAQMFLHMFIKGTGLLKATFNPDLVNDAGIGHIQVEAVDPTYVYVDPDATCVEDASFIIEAKPVSLRYIAQRWPDKLPEVLKNPGSASLDMRPRGDQGLGLAPSDEGKRIDLWECWYHDASIVEIDGSETDTTVKVKAAYPTGRYTLMTGSGVVLDDKPNPYDRFPYIRFVEIPMPGEFWGGCTLDKAADIQLTINSILRSIIDNGLWLVHGIWIADDTSGVSPKSLSAYGPRDVVVKRQGTDVRRDSGSPLPPHLFETLKQQIEAFDHVVGLPDVLRGIVPSRQPVATVAQQQEAGELRTRERGRQVELGLTALAAHLFDLVRNHWSDTRTISVKSPTAGMQMFELTKKDFEGWKGAIRVLPGSTLPMDRSAALSRALSLKNESGIPIPDGFLVKLADIPGLEAAMTELNALAPPPAAEDAAPASDGPLPGDPAAQGHDQAALDQAAQGLLNAPAPDAAPLAPMGDPNQLPPMG